MGASGVGAIGGVWSESMQMPIEKSARRHKPPLAESYRVTRDLGVRFSSPGDRMPIDERRWPRCGGGGGGGADGPAAHEVGM